MKTLEKIALIFTILGAINWLLIGLFDTNLVEMLISNNVVRNIIYLIIGVCGLINIGLLFMNIEEHEK